MSSAECKLATSSGRHAAWTRTDRGWQTPTQRQTLRSADHASGLAGTHVSRSLQQLAQCMLLWNEWELYWWRVVVCQWQCFNRNGRLSAFHSCGQQQTWSQTRQSCHG